MVPAFRFFRFRLLITASLVAAGVGLFFAPPVLTETIRSSVRDAASPGQVAIRTAALWCEDTFRRFTATREQSLQLAELESQIEAWQLRCRRIELDAISLKQEVTRLAANGPTPFAAASGQPLIVPELIEATILGRETTAARDAARLLDRGTSDAIDPESFVLKTTEALLDQGADADVAASQPVYSGRAVIGKIVQAGRFTSTLQLVTDADYRGHARLARSTPNGPLFGTDGLLEGTGEELCRLKFIPSTEPVGIGDDVYTAQNDNTLPAPMYYGSVVKAELKPGAPHWDIWIKPAATADHLRTVQILRKSLNPVRLLAQ